MTRIAAVVIVVRVICDHEADRLVQLDDAVGQAYSPYFQPDLRRQVTKLRGKP